MYCEKCGKKNEDGAVFCDSCGNSFNNSVSQNQVQSQPKTVNDMMKSRYGEDYATKINQKSKTSLGGKKITGIVLIAIGILGIFLTAISKTNIVEAIPPSIIFIIIGLVLMLSRTKAQKEQNKKIQTKQPKKLYVTHITGLPLAEGATCFLFNDANKIQIESSGVSFSLPLCNVTDVTIKTDTEIQKQYVSSVGSAVGGAVLFGPIGAIVGGRAKKKKIKTQSHYLLITYLKDDIINYVCFEVVDIYGVSKWITTLGEYKRVMKKVEL